MTLGHSAWKETRGRLQELLSANNSEIRDNNELLGRYTFKITAFVHELKRIEYVWIMSANLFSGPLFRNSPLSCTFQLI